MGLEEERGEEGKKAGAARIRGGTERAWHDMGGARRRERRKPNGRRSGASGAHADQAFSRL